ncbi:MAG TPA: hypothetical protein VL651_11555 [Bacteroidia bacterium]|jgi:hypothetical protein|nr:hypothetical protein [Bacteroidia bacterium]
MKKFFFFFLFVSVIQISYAQGFTKPDSLAIIINKVKEVRIYYTGNGTKESLQLTNRYNEKGQCIFSMAGTPSSVNYYYLYSYDSLGRMKRSEQRKMSGASMTANDFEYFPDGKISRTAFYYGYDTIFPSRVCEYDERGNTLTDTYLARGQFGERNTMTYNTKNEVVTKLDSNSYFPLALAWKNNQVVRISDYDTVLHTSDNWYLFYDSTGFIDHTIHLKPGINDTARPKYFSDGTYLVFINGNPANADQNYEWRRQFDVYTPKKANQLFDGPLDALPYSDPPPQESITHQLIYDKSGNLKKDIVISSFDQDDQHIFFTYKYEFWK